MRAKSLISIGKVGIFEVQVTDSGIIDPITASTYANRGLECRPFDPPIPFDQGILYPANRPRPLLVQPFAEVLNTAMLPLVQT